MGGERVAWELGAVDNQHTVAVPREQHACG